jgi:hypothetical protein
VGFLAHRSLVFARILVVSVVAALVLASARDAAAGPPGPKIPPITFGIFDGTLKQITDLKTTWHRVHAKWGFLEPTQGNYNFSSFDQEVVPASRRGLKVIIAVHANSAWGSVCESVGVFSAPKQGKVAAFKAFVRALAERYDGDGVDDAPGLGTPVRHFQVENQWVTAVFFRDSTNCPSGGVAHAEQIMGYEFAGQGPPEATGNPIKAANEYAREYNAIYTAVKSANRQAVVGPGNIPTQTADASLFCQGKLGNRFIQNILRPDGSIALTIEWKKPQVCKKAGANERNIKTWVRYWNVVLETVMPKIKSRVNYIDLAHYGRWSEVKLRNDWAYERARAWGFPRKPILVAWELAGPDRRVSIPGNNPRREVVLELPKRIALAFASGSAAVTWFHNHFNPAAAVGVRYTSLLDENGKKDGVYWNYRNLVNEVDGAKGARLDKRGDAYLVKFTFKNGTPVTVAWSAKGPRQVTVAVKDSSPEVIQLNGRRNAPTRTEDAPGGKLNIQLTQIPILIIG